MDNVKEFTSMDTIKDEAATWVVRIHGYTYKTGEKLPAEEQRALRQWMAQSQAHRDTFLKMLNSWDAMGVLEDLAEILPLADIETGKHKTPSHNPPSESHGAAAGQAATRAQARPNRLFPWSRPSWRSLGAMAGGLSVAVALVLVVVLMLPQQNNYATGIGQQASYTLEDGSAINLNTNSEVTVEYSDDRRLVTLTKGEASFTVAKDPQRPFVVYAGQGAVWAVGTVFNVDYSQQLVDVIVSEGTVKVFSKLNKRTNNQTLKLDESIRDQTRAVLVDAGQGAKYRDIIVAKEALSKAELQKRLAWQQGALIFEGETLAEAIEQISRYTDQQLIIADASISRARVGGRFKTNDIDQLLHSLARSLNINMEQREDNKILFTAKQK